MLQKNSAVVTVQRYRDGSPRETLRGGRKATKHGTESDRLENAAVVCSVIFRRPVSTHEVLRCTVQYNTEMKEESTAVGPQRLAYTVHTQWMGSSRWLW